MNLKKLEKNKNRNSTKKRKQNNEEIYRELRTNIEFSSFNKKMQVVCVTSAHPGEGKSTTSVNLAAVSAAKYSKVLLIDCDLRKPTIHKKFNISNNEGLSNLLLQKDLGSEEIHYLKKIRGKVSDEYLYVLTAGAKVPNPQELLSSDKFKELIKQLRSRFDFIVIDCPPALYVSDPIPVGNLSDGMLLVVSAMDTSRKDAKYALTMLQRNGVNVIGTVLSKVDVESNRYYYKDY